MGKNIIVTGAKGNVGQFMVQKLAEAGDHVIAISRSQHTFPNGITHFNIDLTNDQQVALMVDDIYQKFTKIDAVICTAGGFAMGNFSSTGKKELQQMISANFETAYYLTRHVLNKMINQATGGKFIFFGAKAALEIEESNKKLAYAFSKSLVHNLSTMINSIGKNNNIASYVIAPGTIDTEENRQSMPQADNTGWVAMGEIVKKVITLLEEKHYTERNHIIQMG